MNRFPGGPVPLLLATLLSLSGAGGSEPSPPPLEAAMTPDRREITVGDWIQMTLTIRHRSGMELHTPEIGSEPGPFSIGEITGPEESKGEDGRTQISYRFPITVYRPGPHTFPAIPILGIDAVSREEIASHTAPVEITVSSVLSDPSGEPADIKEQAELPGGIGPWLWLLAALAVAGAATWVYLRRRKRVKGGGVPEPREPEIPAHDWAYQRLETLLDSDLLPRGRVQEFYVELAEILKGYLNRRFRITTLERTTEEVIHSLRASRKSRTVAPNCRDALSHCDLVKFARYLPGEAKSRSVVELTYRIVDHTREREIDPEVFPPPGRSPDGAAGAGGR